MEAMVSQTECALASVGLTHAQFVLLLAVGELEPVSADTLGRILVVGSDRAGGELAALYDKGALLEQHDGRAALVVTTAHGRSLLQRAVPLWEAAQRRIRRAMQHDDFQRDVLAAVKKPATMG